jgi:1-acyl-sn-glycerol-3-phosphate acyltransferase
MLLLLRLVRKIAGWADFLVVCVLVYLLAWLPWPGKHPVARLFHAWCRAFARALDVDIRVHQKFRCQHLPRRYILIANHPSAFEDIGIPAMFDVVSVAKLQVKDWFVAGRIARAAGTLFVDRDNPHSRKQVIQEMVKAVEAGQNIALYPEGGCKGRRLFKEFKTGAFEVSFRTGVPILPVFLHYEAQDDFEWQPPYTLPDKIRHILRAVNNRANFYVYDPMDPKDYADRYAMKAAAYRLFARCDAQYLG